MNKISKLKLIFLFSIIYFLFSASAIFAAEFSFNPQFIQARPGDEFSVKLLLNTQGQKINAVEGKIVFPAGKLEVKEISDGNSIINLWAQKPALNDGNITFAGVIPGGYNSQEGLVLSISFKSKEEGGGLLHLEELKSLLNDGLGTASSITSKDFQFLISRTAFSPAISTDTPDQERPESFVVYLSKDKNIFDGKWFVVFATQDKKSGINRHEIAEDKTNVGLPLGNLTSQLFVNIYMNEFDQFIKHKLKVKYYIRYADDFVVFSKNKIYLEQLIPQLGKFLGNNLRLTLHPQKLFIRTLASGVDFLGWVIFPHHLVPRTSTKKRMFKRLQQHCSKKSLTSYTGILGHGNTYKIVREIKTNYPDFLFD